MEEIERLRLRLAELENRRAGGSSCGRPCMSQVPGVAAAQYRPDDGSTLAERAGSAFGWRVVFDSVTDAICLLDPEGTIIDCNDAMLKLLDKPPGEVLGRTCWSLVHGTDGPVEGCPVVRMRRSLSRESMELPVGDGRWFDVLSHPVLDKKGALLGAIHILSDITKRKHAEEELQKLASVVRYSSECINLAALDGKMLFLNDAGVTMLGIDAGDVEKTYIMDVVPDHLKEKVRDEILPILLEQGRWEGELQLQNVQNGRLIDVFSIAFSIKDPITGEPLLLANILRDISARKRTEESLRQSEEKFYKAFKANPNFMTILSIEDLRYIDANDAFLEAIGYTRWELIGRTVEELGICERAAIDGHLQELNESGRVRDAEVLFRTKTGDFRTARISAEIIRIDGHPRCLVAANDITEQKKAEVALRESRQQLFDIIDFLPDATYVVDLEGCLIAWNRAMVQATGITKEEILGKHKDAVAISFYGRPRPVLVDLLIRDDPADWSLYEDVERRGDTLVAEVLILGTDTVRGSYVSASASPLYDSSGKVVGAIESVRNITERKKMEAALQERERELEKKSLDLEETNTALRVLLKSREEDQKEFAFNIMTNLKELVFPYVDNLKESRLSDLQRTFVSILESHLLEIGTPFLKRLTTGCTNLSPVERQVASLIKEGRRNKEISEILGVSPNTVSSHRYHLRTKLGLKNKNINLATYLQSLDI